MSVVRLSGFKLEGKKHEREDRKMNKRVQMLLFLVVAMGFV